jgi:hypothetical protein
MNKTLVDQWLTFELFSFLPRGNLWKSIWNRQMYSIINIHERFFVQKFWRIHEFWIVPSLVEGNVLIPLEEQKKLQGMARRHLHLWLPSYWEELLNATKVKPFRMNIYDFESGTDNLLSSTRHVPELIVSCLR